MKICMISTFPPMRDGVGDYSYNLAEALHEKCNIFVLSSKCLSRQDLNLDGIYVMPCWSRDDPFYSIKLAYKISRLKPDVVHVQHVHLMYGWPAGLPLMPLLIYLKAKGIPVLTTLHNIGTLKGFDAVSNKLMAKARKYSFLLSTKLVCQLSTRVHVMKGDDAWLLVEEFCVSKEKIVVVPHGVPDARITPIQLAKEKVGLKGKFVIECFGFAQPGKGYEYAIEAMGEVLRRIPEAVLVFVGGYNPAQDETYAKICMDCLSKLKAIVEELGLIENVRFVDVVSREEMPLYISAADVHLFPYEGGGGASGALHTVAVYAKPVVVTDVGRFNEIVDGVDGLKVPPRDPEAIAKAIMALYRDETLAESLAKNLLESVKGREWKAIGERTLEVYESMIRESRKTSAILPLAK